ncbi:bifunctional folylpolyglutamate synthase/dihydrofolate synthase [Edaphobacillus lindanitolerans]|uniref:tetrahydrofolate synthase n=1 Tax=Edaphobacillus lindanitolerans TaxID=550447 RepID=A0A1U7PQA5_9BACI|nr:folylpolyglutamate synthase/dihydrofolate synthase family protein [Edaphobacillus lindanitolerans]SIT83315.1 dihydrofolate synthase / folylpolyglutamate synthase [Edaphobacillus lindanitolerans]
MIPKLDLYKEKYSIESADEIRPGLEAMEEAMQSLGHPEKTGRFIHVAGTNGKGSTVAFLDSIARAHGLRTAAFTSPAVTDLHDQITIGGEPISESGLDRAFSQIQSANLSGRLTDFELLTTAAFLAFREAQPDLILLEAGMGGSLDSTNVVDPEVSVITSVALDHTGFLGGTLSEIAAHKSGILKPGKPGVIGPLPEEAMEATVSSASKIGVPLHVYGRDFRLDWRTFTNSRTFCNLEPGLDGPHQRQNLALAIEALLLAGIRLEEAAVVQGAGSASVPGRFEEIAPNVFLDGAHNPAAAEALVRTVREKFGREAKVHFLIGMLARKDYQTVIRLLEPVAESMTFVTFPHGEAATADQLAAAASLPSRRITLGEVQKAERFATSAPTVITGSLYLLSAIRPLFLQNTKD